MPRRLDILPRQLLPDRQGRQGPGGPHLGGGQGQVPRGGRHPHRDRRRAGEGLPQRLCQGVVRRGGHRQGRKVLDW